jgi:hypothetical protein
VEFAQPAGTGGCEWFELVRLRGVEAGFFGGLLFGERQQRFDGLSDVLQQQGALMAVVVGRIDRLCRLLAAERPFIALLRGPARGETRLGR